MDKVNKAGRKSLFKEDTIERAKAYIQGGHVEEGDPVPTVEGLAVFLGVGRSTVYDWANDEEKTDGITPFSDILELCNTVQSKKLLSGALANDLNANIAKLMLGKQGYSERTIQEHRGGIDVGLHEMDEDEIDMRIQQKLKQLNEE